VTPGRSVVPGRSDEALTVRAATADDAAAISAVTRAAFAGQEALDPPSGAASETVSDVAAWLARHGGLVVTAPGGEVVAAARFSHQDGGFWLRRVAVRPDLQGGGLAGLLLAAAEHAAARSGHGELRIGVRAPLTGNLAHWRRRGFVERADHGFWVELRRRLPVEVVLPAPDDTESLGRRLAGRLRRGDLVLLSGELGAGKTTLARGLGGGLGVRGDVTSPTFVIARVHPSVTDGPALVHVDAYRLGDLAEVDDLDLDASLEESVTVVEWGEGKVEGLADDRLEIALRRGSDPADETRTAHLRPVGPRWSDVELP
jgi:tRNA threonylcarbamoyladenosine biosynthesis protein TsaE